MPRNKYSAECHNKMVYKRPSLAARVISRMMRQNPNETPLDVYKCEICGKWHIGHNEPRQITVVGPH